MWSSSRHINYGLPPEFFLVAPASSAANLDIGVIPLLTATPCQADDDLLNNSRNRMQLWQHQQQAGQNLIKPMTLEHAETASGGSTCRDCGNQAKKDCSHRRCRTCCKSRGYDCATHVKSTWVPAARRRERLMAAANGGSSQSTSGSKKARLGATSSHTSTSNTTPPGSFDTSCSPQDASFKESLPGQVRAPAVFKCVRVSAIDGGEDEYAYQAAVTIGGHVFKGFLYDQGIVEVPNISDLHLSGGAPVVDAAGGNPMN